MVSHGGGWGRERQCQFAPESGVYKCCWREQSSVRFPVSKEWFTWGRVESYEATVCLCAFFNKEIQNVSDSLQGSSLWDIWVTELYVVLKKTGMLCVWCAWNPQERALVRTVLWTEQMEEEEAISYLLRRIGRSQLLWTVVCMMCPVGGNVEKCIKAAAGEKEEEEAKDFSWRQ